MRARRRRHPGQITAAAQHGAHGVVTEPLPHGG
jgi:hypothetical protein